MFHAFRRLYQGYIYLAGVKGSFERTILPVCHTKSFFWPGKSERARPKCVRVIRRVSPFYLLLLAVVLLG